MKLQIPNDGALRDKPTSEATDWVLSRLGIGHKPADANVARPLDGVGSSYDQLSCMATLYGCFALFFFCLGDSGMSFKWFERNEWVVIGIEGTSRRWRWRSVGRGYTTTTSNFLWPHFAYLIESSALALVQWVLEMIHAPITAAHVADYYLCLRTLPAPWELEVNYLMGLSCMLERRLISSHPFCRRLTVPHGVCSQF